MGFNAARLRMAESVDVSEHFVADAIRKAKGGGAVAVALKTEVRRLEALLASLSAELLAARRVHRIELDAIRQARVRQVETQDEAQDEAALQMPTVVVSTPAAFLSMVQGCDAGHQRHIVKTLQHIVFDEADILLTAFDSDIRRLWALLAFQTLVSRVECLS